MIQAEGGIADWVLTIGALTGLIGGIVAIARYFLDRRTGISSEDRATRREEAADWAAFVSELRGSLSEERARMADAAGRIDILEQRLEEKVAQIHLLIGRVAVLEDHIWKGLGPPPPARS